jgi:hypothetical protein
MELDNIDFTGNMFVINKNKYNYSLLMSTHTKKDIKMLHIKNLGTTTENYLYTEKIESSPNNKDLIDPLLLKLDNELQPIMLNCFYD